jgi:hypothetical protein
MSVTRALALPKEQRKITLQEHSHYLHHTTYTAHFQQSPPKLVSCEAYATVDASVEITRVAY